ncbi:YtxH domain-containing protein [Clostridium sporogenes]|uniref:YtxH domain-containing protein n=1 Tax=Clostridium sporogenes TaxID=1509 RepID=A0AAE4FKC8_CLOSG|nr:YtxH domain-containing protein [Clostridium sporogenes]MDS1002967.1 YtxH domain-containing protein [Clostridium sporogenes]
MKKTKNNISKVIGATVAIAGSIFIVKKLNNKCKQNNCEEIESNKAFKTKIHNLKSEGNNLKNKMKDKGKDIKENLRDKSEKIGEKLNVTNEDINNIYEGNEDENKETSDESLETSENSYEGLYDNIKKYDFYENIKEKNENN